MKKWRQVLFLCVLIGFIYFVFFRDKFPLVKELPAVMKKQYDVVYLEPGKRATLEKNGISQNIGITFDKNKTLYIANSYGKDITKVTIDKEKNEIYIRKDVFNGHEGDYKFQLITFPYSSFKGILNDKKVNIYIDYGIGYELREYNIINSECRMLKYAEPTK